MHGARRASVHKTRSGDALWHRSLAAPQQDIPRQSRRDASTCPIQIGHAMNARADRTRMTWPLGREGAAPDDANGALSLAASESRGKPSHADVADAGCSDRWRQAVCAMTNCSCILGRSQPSSVSTPRHSFLTPTISIPITSETDCPPVSLVSRDDPLCGPQTVAARPSRRPSS
jgi:hypothetical protein